MIELFPLIVLGFAAYRVTRAIIFDTWIEGLRQRWYVMLLNGDRFTFVRGKIVDLTSCTFCMGFWVSLLIYSLYLGEFPSSSHEYISVFAVAGVQAFIHTVEPDDHEE